LSKVVLPVENTGQSSSLPTIEEIEEPELKNEEKEGPEATENTIEVKIDQQASFKLENWFQW
jgi:hypothetical protein